MVKISIVMPCYNMAPFMRDCFESLFRQTLKEFEAICVDDGSTDSTPEIIGEYAAKDPRIKLITQANLGVFAARNNAMKVAKGEYICFLDPDDWYPAGDTLERMYTAARANNADICGGGWSRHHPDGRVETVFTGFMEGLNTFASCGFLDYADYQFDLGYQRFLFRTRLIKDNHIEFPPYKRFQDPPFLVKAMVAAGRLYTLDFVTYSYRVGHKSVDWSSDDYRKLKDYLRGLADNMRVARAHGLEKLFRNNRDRACGSFFWQTAGSALATRGDVFEVYRQMFDDPADFLKSLAAGYWRHPRDLALLLERNKVVTPPPARRIATIGIHYYHLTVGGVQRVIALQAQSFLKQGYRVVMFIEDTGGARHFDLPPGVEVVSYPRTLGKDAVLQAARIDAVVRTLQEHPVDVFYSHAHLSPLMLWDILTVRMVCRLPYILHYHSMFTAPLYAGGELTYDRFLEAMPQHRLCDRVISLSRGDLAYERMNGVNAVYLPNPVDPALSNVPLRDAPVDPLIVWVGRIDEQKCPVDAVRIFAKVRERIPNARMRIIGDGAEWLVKAIRRVAGELKLGESLELPGSKGDVYADYAESSLCLSTSRIEGFPMVSFEALCHGLPIVAYALPQTEIYRDNPAVLQVGSGDIVGAAEAICQLLKDPSRLKSLREAARISVKPFIEYDFVSAWQNIFRSLEGTEPARKQGISDEDKAMMLGTLFAGITAMRMRVAVLRKQVADRDKSLADIRSQLDMSTRQRDAVERDLADSRKKCDAAERNLADSRKKCDAAVHDLSASRQVYAAEKKQKGTLQDKLRRSTDEVAALKASAAYRTGMFVTWPLRKIYRMTFGRKRPHG